MVSSLTFEMLTPTTCTELFPRLGNSMLTGAPTKPRKSEKVEGLKAPISEWEEINLQDDPGDAPA